MKNIWPASLGVSVILAAAIGLAGCGSVPNSSPAYTNSSPATRALPDHYAFERNPFTDVDADAILITEKDAVKLGTWHDARIWVVPVEAALDHRLTALVVEKVRGRSPA